MSWPKACLGDVAQVVSGATPKSSVDHYWDGDIPWITPADLSKLEGKEVWATSRRITEAGLASCSARLLPPKSVLLSSRAPIGHVAINTVPMATNQGFKSFVPDQEILSSDFLYWWLKSNKSYLQSLGRGATFKEVSKEIVESIEIPLPPLEEQRRIAAILDKSNEILSLRRKSLGRFESLTDSIFVRMFGNPFSADSGRSHVPFREMTERITYGFTSPMAHMESGIPILTAKNIQDGFIDLENVHYARQDEFDALTSKCKPSPGDILITKDGSIGRCAIAPAEGPLCINQSVALVIPDRSRVVPEYVSAYVRCTPVQQRIQRMGKGNALKHLQITELAEFPSVIPPLADQMKFADLISAVERKRDKSKEGVLWAERMARSLCFSLFECTFDKHQDLRKETNRQDSIAI